MESMRLYPPAAGLGRTAANGLKCGGYEIPDGTTIIVRTSLVYTLHLWASLISVGIAHLAT